MRTGFRRLAALSCLALAFHAHAARLTLPAEQVQVNQLLAETQKSSASPSSLDLVWWIPPQFWPAVMQGEVDPRMRKELDELFGKYTVVAAVKGSMGALGPDNFLSDAQLRAQLRMLGADGAVYAPIEAGKLDQRLTVLIQMMRPMFSNLLGQMGSNVQFFAFPATAKGKPLADPLGEGTLVFRLGGDDYAFRLPLGSLLVPQRDAQSGELFPGSYQFNPYTGAALQPAPPAATTEQPANR